MLALINDDDADQFSDGYPVWECSRICEWTVSGLHLAISSDESWVMKFYDCTLKGLVWMQALETRDSPFGSDNSFSMVLKVFYHL